MAKQTERLWHWSEDEEANSLMYISRRDDDFVQIPATDLTAHHPGLRDYQRIVENEEQWKALLLQMNYVFADKDLNPFPYGRGVEAKRSATGAEAIAQPTRLAAVVSEAEQQNESVEPAPSNAPQAPVKNAAGEATERRMENWERRWRRTWSRIVGFPLPADFSDIHIEMIERRFRNGSGARPVIDDANRKRVDGDTRGLITALRYVTGENLHRLIKERRQKAGESSRAIIVAFALVMVVALGVANGREILDLLPSSPDGQLAQVVLAVLAAIGIAASGFFVRFVTAWISGYRDLTRNYEAAMHASCVQVSQQVTGRFNDIGAQIAGAHNAIKLEAAQPWGAITPRKAERLSQVALWLGLRAEHLALFLQAEMWQTRRLVEAQLRLNGYRRTLTALVRSIVWLALVYLLAAVVGGLLSQLPGSPEEVARQDARFWFSASGSVIGSWPFWPLTSIGVAAGTAYVTIRNGIVKLTQLRESKSEAKQPKRQANGASSTRPPVSFAELALWLMLALAAAAVPGDALIWAVLAAGLPLAGAFLFFMNRVVLREQRTGRNILQDTLAVALGPAHAQLKVLARESAASYANLLENLAEQKRLLDQGASRPAQQSR